MNKRIKVGITHGDYNGIGYEVILKVLCDPAVYELFTPVLYGSPQVLAFYRKLLNVNLPHPTQLVKSAADAMDGMLNIVSTDDTGIDLRVSPGEPSRYAGTMAARALEDVRRDLREKTLEVVVTAPINKDTIQSSDFQYKGHTEFFAESFSVSDQLMLFVSEELRVAIATTHLSIREVPDALTPDLLKRKLMRLEESLITDFGIVKPRIGVLSLNPHMGENGLIGTEEINIVTPALRSIWEEGVFAFGPVSPDAYWGSRMYQEFDATLAIYHDQGLIPFKLLAMSTGVNVTCGLPIVRTSPDHGTAYDIAGKGIADEQSLRNAIYVAIDIYRKRKIHQENTANPLQKRYVEKGKDNVKLDLLNEEE